MSCTHFLEWFFGDIRFSLQS